MCNGKSGASPLQLSLLLVHKGTGLFFNLERHLTGDQHVHFFLVGAGALLDSGSSKNFLLGKPVNNACLQGNPADHPAHCYFYWFTKVWFLHVERKKCPLSL